MPNKTKGGNASTSPQKQPTSRIKDQPAFTQRAQSQSASTGLIKAHPSEYKEVPFTLQSLLLNFAIFYIFIFFPLLAIHQETFRAGASINLLIRKYVYGQGNLHDYLALDPLNQPYDDVVPECDWETLTPKDFYQQYVRTSRPCLFKNYGKQQKAYQKWNEEYMREVSGDDIIFAER